MDPARLAEIEAAYPLDPPASGYSRLPIAAVVIHELIAEIRELQKRLARVQEILDRYGRDLMTMQIVAREQEERWTKRG